SIGTSNMMERIGKSPTMPPARSRAAASAAGAAFVSRSTRWSGSSEQHPGDRGDQAEQHDQRVAGKEARLHLARTDGPLGHDPGNAVGAEPVDQADIAALPQLAAEPHG